MLKRTPIKRYGGTLKRGVLRKKSLSQEQKDERKIQSEKDWSFYEEVWNERSHQCEVHDGYKFLGYTINKCLFDHILEKSQYPHLRYEKRNIALVCRECHSQKTNGMPTKIHKQKVEEVKELFNIQ